MKQNINLNKIKQILIIDGNSLLYRAFYATQHLANKQMFRQTTNGVFIAMKMLKKMLDQTNTYQKVYITFDLGKNTKRHQAYKEYKSQRTKTPEALIEQIPLFKNFMKALKIPIFENPEHEADDLIATIAKRVLKHVSKCKVDVLSSDRDFLQLVNKNIRLLLFATGISKLKVINSDNFSDIFHIQPNQIPDYKALIGDNSDNLPGIKGIGPKGAHKLLNLYNSLEEIYNKIKTVPERLQQKLLVNGAYEQARMVKKLVILDNQVPIKIEFQVQTIDFHNPEIEQLFKKYNMKSFLVNVVQKSFEF